MAKTGVSGFRRIINAARYSSQGIKAAYQHEAAFRQECWLAVILVPVGLYLGGTTVEKSLLIGSVLLVLVVELLNSAIEAIVDRISDEHHTLAGRAKDMGSAAVMITMILTAVIWLAVFLPFTE